VTLEQRLALARNLIARRDAIDTELMALFRGEHPSRKGQRQCRHCGDPGHRSDACPQLDTVDKNVATPTIAMSD